MESSSDELSAAEDFRAEIERQLAEIDSTISETDELCASFYGRESRETRSFTPGNN
jgi:hypothetical protein